MRKPVMAGNWKMYKTPAETIEFFERFRGMVEQATHCEIAIFPSFISLAAAVELTIGVDAERKSLEEVAPPLSQADAGA